METRLTTSPIEYSSLVESVRGSRSGAVVLFLGTVREMSEGRPVSGLTYDAYPPMAESKLREIVESARRRWSLDEAVVVHRYGDLQLGDVAVAIVTASPHRDESFESARWIMDTIKQTVPIWKREHWSDGSASWVHPDSGRGPRKLDEDPER